MSRRALRVLLLATVALVAGCAVQDEGGCTAVGGISGVRVNTSPEVGPISSLDLRICQDGRCETARVPLEANLMQVEDSECSPSADSTCAGLTKPDGTQVGFVTANLNVGEAEVSGSYESGGTVNPIDTVTVQVEPTYPNGRQCDPSGAQATARLTPAGLAD